MALQVIPPEVAKLEDLVDPPLGWSRYGPWRFTGFGRQHLAVVVDAASLFSGRVRRSRVDAGGNCSGPSDLQKTEARLGTRRVSPYSLSLAIS